MTELSQSQLQANVVRNRLLALTSVDDRAALRQHLKPYRLEKGVTLLQAHAPIEHIYFVTDGLVSLGQILENGKYAASALVGRDGMVGALALLGESVPYIEAVVQIPGTSLRMPADALRIEASQRPAFHDLLVRYVQALFAQVTQTVSCNSHHPLPKRLARWLAVSSDFFTSDTLPLTQEALAIMLGVRRSGVTTGLGALKSAGLVDLYKGGVRVTDRAGLGAAACECYGAIKQEYDRLFGRSTRSVGYRDNCREERHQRPLAPGTKLYRSVDSRSRVYSGMRNS